jgi:hypothetical protein
VTTAADAARLLSEIGVALGAGVDAAIVDQAATVKVSA